MSWASVNGAIELDQDSKRCWHLCLSLKKLAVVTRVRLTPKTRDPFGQIKAAVMEITGGLCYIHVWNEIGKDVPDNIRTKYQSAKYGSVYEARPDEGIFPAEVKTYGAFGYVLFDSYPPPRNTELMCLPLIGRWKFEWKRSRGGVDFRGLLLKRVQGEKGTYTRVGIVHMRAKIPLARNTASKSLHEDLYCTTRGLLTTKLD